jgi:hypothetical protein
MKGYSRQQDKLLKQAAPSAEKKDKTFTQSFMQEFDLKMQQWEREDNEAHKAKIRDKLDQDSPSNAMASTKKEEQTTQKSEIIKEKIKEEPVNEFPPTEGIPFMVTSKMKKQLFDLGYPLDVVKSFVPKDAYFICQNKIKFTVKPPVTDFPNNSKNQNIQNKKNRE